jgi:hypothetical protein
VGTPDDDDNIVIEFSEFTIPVVSEDDPLAGRSQCRELP